ncbi:MAG: hypothetical protein ACLFUC_09080 [Bacteroidales bacterium]
MNVHQWDWTPSVPVTPEPFYGLTHTIPCGFSSIENSDVSGEKFVVQLFPVIGEWNEHELVWDNKPEIAPGALSEVTVMQGTNDYSFLVNTGGMTKGSCTRNPSALL